MDASQQDGSHAGYVLVLVENCSVPSDTRVWWECGVLTDAGYRVTVISPQGSRVDVEKYEARDGVAIHRYPAKDRPAGKLRHIIEYLQAAWHITGAVLRLGRRHHFAIVHACNPPDFLLLTALPLKLPGWRNRAAARVPGPKAPSAKRRGARFIFDHHDLSPEMFLALYGDDARLLHRATRLLERLAFGLADVVISTNESYRRVALGRGRKRPDNVFVVRNAPDLARFQPRPPDHTLKRGAGHLLVFVGLMGKQDGVDEALAALTLLRRRRRDWRALFVGHGPALQSSRQRARALRLDDVVEFTGYISNEDVVRVLATADVCLSPERPNAFTNASSWIKLGEYMAMAKPIVCFDLAESRHTAGPAARYARPGDTGHFAECISDLLDDPHLRAEMGKAGRARVEGHLSREHARRALLQAYDRALCRS